MSHIKAIQNPHISHRLSHTIPIFGPCMSHINSFGKGMHTRQSGKVSKKKNIHTRQSEFF